jgi:hypothetical protein
MKKFSLYDVDSEAQMYFEKDKLAAYEVKTRSIVFKE